MYQFRNDWKFARMLSKVKGTQPCSCMRLGEMASAQFGNEQISKAEILRHDQRSLYILTRHDYPRRTLLSRILARLRALKRVVDSKSKAVTILI